MFILSSEISIGNILTTVSVIFAMATFFYSESQKRNQIERAYYAEIRTELGRVLREIAQMEAELKLFFISVEPRYVTASEIAMSDDRDVESQDAEKARDFIWREIPIARSKMEERILAASAQSNGLAIAGINIQTEYEDYIEQHTNLRLQAYAELSQVTQAALHDSSKNATYSAEIGNALRDAHYGIERTVVGSAGELNSTLNRKIHEVALIYE